MKKIAFIGIAIATAMGFTACQKENLSNGQTEGQLISETFTATLGQEATKTTISSDAKTVEWSANDKVYYYSKDGGAVRSFTISAAGASASLTLEREDGDTYYNLVYAGNTEPTFTTKTGTSMVFDGVKPAQDGTFANTNVSVARTTPGGGGITFKPVVPIVKFTTARTDIKTIVLTGGNGEKVAGSISVDPTAASPVAALDGDGSTSITVTIATPAAGTYYIGVVPHNYPNGLKMTLKDASGSFIGTVTASKSTGLCAGDAMINYGNVDTHINATTVLDGRFSVGASKQVQFTRGNLYWDGWTWKLEASQSDYPTAWNSNHVGHLYWTKNAANSYAETYSDGTCTTSDVPFFAESMGGLTVEGTSGLFALSKEEWEYLLNISGATTGRQDANRFAKAMVNGKKGLVVFPDGYNGGVAISGIMGLAALNSYYDVAFPTSTMEDATWSSMESAGCVFLPAAGFWDGSTLSNDSPAANPAGYSWSTTPDGNENREDNAYCLLFTNYGLDLTNDGCRNNGLSVRLVKDCTPTYTEGTYTGKAIRVNGTWWAPVNCGYDATNAPTGLFYQWGRKYGQSNTGAVSYIESQATLMEEGNTEANKDKFYKGSLCWYKGNKTSDTWLSEYDPCPAGWRVPNETELSAIKDANREWISNGGPSSDQTGYKFGTSPNQVFFPVAGCRNCSDGSISYATTYGFYWSSSPSTGDADDAKYLHFGSGDAKMLSYDRADGYSVRCVQE